MDKKGIYCDELRCLKDLDFYQLVKPVADMVLYNWGLKLVGEGDSYNLICFNEIWFKNQLIRELSLKEGL